MSAARRQTIFFYGALFAALGAHLPFWPLWLADWGLSPGEVGLYITLGFATRVIAGIAFPMLADRLDARRVVLSALAAFAALVFALHLFIDARWLLLAARIEPVGEHRKGDARDHLGGEAEGDV
ncbi:MAG: MFS transporter, partial [Pseudomonadota bacterium]